MTRNFCVISTNFTRPSAFGKKICKLFIHTNMLIVSFTFLNAFSDEVKFCINMFASLGMQLVIPIQSSLDSKTKKGLPRTAEPLATWAAPSRRRWRTPPGTACAVAAAFSCVVAHVVSNDGRRVPSLRRMQQRRQQRGHSPVCLLVRSPAAGGRSSISG